MGGESSLWRAVHSRKGGTFRVIDLPDKLSGVIITSQVTLQFTRSC